MATTSRLARRRSRDDSVSSGIEDPEVLREALELAGLGLRVIPLRPRSKEPRIRRWPEKGTTDPRTIRGWFAGRPDDNLGLVTGDGLIALDLDAGPGGLESYGRLIEGRGSLPETARAETGSGGRHILLRVNGGFGNGVNLLPGVDLRGDGGQIVVAPSVHPGTGRPYVWARHPRDGIAEAPEWFVRWLTEPAATGRPSRTTRASSPAVAAITRPPVSDPDVRGVPAPEMPRNVPPTRVGDRADLAAAMIARFPVAGLGHRHQGMTRAVGHLLGSRFDPALVDAVLCDWHAHFHALGLTRTGADEAAREVEACIDSTVRSLERGTFRPATGEVDHEAICHRIRLDASRWRLLSSKVVTGIAGEKTLQAGAGPGEFTPRPAHPPNCKRVTQITKSLCESDDERAFVEALMAQATYKMLHTREYSADRVIRATHDQIRRIAGGSREGPGWSSEQFERLKRKYVTRELDGKPASRFELLREARKGERRRGEPRGRPSEYRPTGILLLLAGSMTPGRVGGGGEEEEPDLPWWRDPGFATGGVPEPGGDEHGMASTVP